MKTRLLWTLPAVAVLACATLPADELVSRGDYESAIPAYEAALKDRPQDAALRARADEARRRLLAQLARRSQEAAAAKDLELARQFALEVLQRFQAWGRAPVVAQPIVEERERWLQQSVTVDIDALLARGAPLRAWQLFEQTRTAAFWTGGAAAGVEDRIRAQGVERCQLALPLAASTGPYAQHVAARYCAAFGIDAGALPPLPSRFGRLDLETSVKGAGQELTAPIQDALREAFRRSAWFDGSTEAVLQARATGELLEVRQVTWTATVPVTRSVSYTVHESYTYACGKSTCRGSRPVTRHRNETHWERRVHQRLEFLRVGEPTPPPIDSEVVIGHAARLRAEIAPPIDGKAEAEPQTKMGAAEARQRGSAREGIAAEARVLGQRFETRLWRAWKEAYCTPEETDPEHAARCVFGAPRESQPRGLSTLFGEDVTARMAVLPEDV